MQLTFLSLESSHSGLTDWQLGTLRKGQILPWVGAGPPDSPTCQSVCVRGVGVGGSSLFMPLPGMPNA